MTRSRRITSGDNIMPLFGHKRSRSSKAASMREASKLSTRLEAALKDRGILGKLMLAVITLLGLLLVVEGWTTPFPYRIGDHVPHGIIARTQFMEVDEIKTEQQRRQEADAVPYILRSGTFPLGALSTRLRSYLTDIASENSYNDLEPETQEAFELTLTANGTESVEQRDLSLEEEFQAIKNMLDSTGFSISSRIDETVSDFESVLAPLEATGILDQAELDRHDIPIDASLAIISEKAEQLPSLEELQKNLKSPVDVLLSEQLSESGRIGRSWSSYPNLEPLREPLTRWLMAQAPVSLSYDSSTTQKYRFAARKSVLDQGTIYDEGSELVLPGSVLDEEDLSLLKSEFEAFERENATQRHLVRAITVLAMFCVLAVLFAYYLRHTEAQLMQSFSRLSIYLGSVLACLFIARQLSYDPWRAEIIPVLVLTMVVAIAFNQVLASLTAFLVCMILTLSTVQDIGHFVIITTVSVSAAISLETVSSRSTLIKVGFMSSVTYFCVTWGINVLQSQAVTDVFTDWELLKSSLRGAAWCLVAGYLVAGSLPFIESAFGTVTDISLLEMSDISHPLLQELVRSAPGTYNHSIAVATIGEAAADAIGANGLLVRVGAYFHDVGKMIKPEYFIENMAGEESSRHKSLNPAMSTLIIIGHVKDGVDLAHQHHLPQAIIDFIEQHHGTTLVEYFFREAERLAEEEDSGTVEEAAFRYPGPKPQSKEAAVMMLADAVESASRTLVEPTAKRIESLVDALTMKRLLDGQFEDSTLTLTELNIVKDKLTKSLIAIYHGRVKYPDQKSA
ncbi:MAG: HDIG domain-containing protein [Planctomycetaceae bacterium]|nr:HDIG domain-containing protein [Planctomycetaceae bacterium]